MDFTTLKDELVNIADDTSITESSKERWINRAYRNIQSRADWSWMLKAATDSTVASTASYTLPTDYKKMFELRVASEDYDFIPYERRNDRTWDGYYSILDTDYYLYPTPTSSGSSDIDLIYFYDVADLSASSDEPAFDKQFHDILVYQALVHYCEKERDLNEASFFKSEVENILTQMKEFYQKQAAQEILRLRDIRERYKTIDTESALSTP